MKGIFSKRWLLCAVIGAALYVAMLALMTLLVLRGALREERIVRGCAVSAFASAFAAALPCRFSGKGTRRAEIVLCGCAFLMPALLAGAALFDGSSAGETLTVAASAMIGSGAASVLFGNAKTGKKKRGRKRGKANR